MAEERPRENEPNRTWSAWTILLPAWVVLLAFAFANVEIQIEGPHGWAAALPTWRIEHSLLQDLFWGGRPLTGYHAWVFSFMAIVFHLPVFVAEKVSLKMEARTLGSLMIFWIVEDFLWFVLNPAFGLAKFTPPFVPWHIHWWLGMPADYWTFLAGGLLLLSYGNGLWTRRRKTA